MDQQNEFAVWSASNITHEDRIKEFSNGRVDNANTLSPEYKGDPKAVMYDNTQEYSLKGIITPNELSDYFFNPYNVSNIQRLIRYNVYKETDKVIDRQSEQEIFIIMRSIYLQYGGKNSKDKDEFNKNIRDLNKRVVDYAVDNISSQLSQLDMYINDISRMPVPMAHPSYENKNNFTYDISNLMEN